MQYSDINSKGKVPWKYIILFMQYYDNDLEQGQPVKVDSVPRKDGWTEMSERRVIGRMRRYKNIVLASV